MQEHRRLIQALGAAIALSIVLGVAVGIRTFGGANLQNARQIAARLQANALANPNPVVTTQPSASTSVAPSTAASEATTPTAPGSTTAPSAAAPGAPGTTKARSSTVAGPPTAGTSTSAASTPSTAAPATAPPVASTLAARRQPTASEVTQAISAVHSLLPMFTPTAAQIASSGNQVCTAFDQGSTFTQVKNAALNMVGAGSLSWLIPSSVPDTAVRTLVALYCPGYAGKLV